MTGEGRISKREAVANVREALTYVVGHLSDLDHLFYRGIAQDVVLDLVERREEGSLELTVRVPENVQRRLAYLHRHLADIGSERHAVIVKECQLVLLAVGQSPDGTAAFKVLEGLRKT